MLLRISVILLALIGVQYPLLSQTPQPASSHTIAGESFDPLFKGESKAVVLIFVASDCPISNRYAPLVNRIYGAYKDKGIDFYCVYPMSSESKESIRSHRSDYSYKLPALIDKDHYLVDKADAMVTPEVSVFLPETGTWIYRGRIDNLYVDFGKRRRNPTENDLTNALDLILAGKDIEPKRTRAVGCYIKE